MTAPAHLRQYSRGAVHAGVFVTAAVILFFVLRPLINAVAKSQALSPLDEEVIGGAITALIAAAAAAIAHVTVFVTAGAPTRKQVGRIVRRMREWLFSLSVHWGLRRSATRRTVANTAEGLIATLHSNDRDVSPVERSIARSAIHFLVRQVSSDGLLSVSLKVHTVHCTAMGLYGIEGAIRSGRYELGRRVRDAAQMLARVLKCSATSYGWGFTTSRITAPADCRVFSTLWALRALNLTPIGLEGWYASQYTSFLRYVPSGRFGFAIDETPRTSMMALFVIGLHELENRQLRDTLCREVDVQAIVREILSDIRTGTGTWEETEEYNVEKYALGVEKLSWSHVTVALAIHALSAWSHLLRPHEHYIVGRLVGRLMRHHVSSSGYYRGRVKNVEVVDPSMFPTSYVISAFQAWVREVTWQPE